MRHVPKKSRPTWTRAFTLVEMVMVMVLLGVLSMMAAPRYANMLRNQRLDSAELRIRYDISMAQRRARYLSTSQTMTFNTALHQYSVTAMPDPDKPASTYTVKLNAEPYGVSLVTANLGGNAILIFDGHGTPDSDGTIVIRLGSQIRTITFAATFIPWQILDQS